MTEGKPTIYEGDQESSDYLKRRLVEYNMQQVPHEGALELEPITIIIKEDDGQIIGGINATIMRYWKRCHIDIFWMEEKYRSMGYGRKLLEKVEQIALYKGCKLIQLETYNFQDPEFYQKNGYEIFGVLESDLPKYSQYFLKKTIQ